MIRSNKPEDPTTETPRMPTNSGLPQFASTGTPSEKAVEEKSLAAVIGPKIRIKGELVGEEDLLIQGHVDGTIDLKANHLTIGDQGVVKANVLAQNIVVKGTVEGDLFGEDRISILSSSNVKGNLVAKRVTLEDGAKFKGSIDMDIEERKEDFQRFNEGSSITTNSKPASSTPEPNKVKPKTPGSN